MPRHFSEIERENIRSELIRVGLELFERYGIDKTNIEDITNKVGIAKGSFYAFFNSKGDLFMEIYSVEREKVQEKAVAIFRDFDGEIDEIIKSYVLYLRQALKERPILNIVYDSNALMMISDKSVRERLLHYNRLINDQMTELIQGWMDRRGPFSVEARIVTSMLRSINFLQFHDYAIGDDVFEETVSTLTEAVVQLVKNSRGSR